MKRLKKKWLYLETTRKIEKKWPYLSPLTRNRLKVALGKRQKAKMFKYK
jgi:hypothetical protein